jgi:hypothetical protein
MFTNACSKIALITFVVMSSVQIAGASEANHFSTGSMANLSWQLNYSLRSSNSLPGSSIIAARENQDVFSVQTTTPASENR